MKNLKEKHVPSNFTSQPVDNLTLKQLILEHNKLATKLEKPPVSRFANKTKAIIALKALMAIDECRRYKRLAEKQTKKSNPRKAKAGKATFGKNISAEGVHAAIEKVFGTLFITKNIKFVDKHYWYCDLKLKGSKLAAKKVRVDYLVNYMRIPRAFSEQRKAILEHVADIQKQKK